MEAIPLPALPKHVHIVSICGVATGALAIALHQKGVLVTGSDKGFFPPMSTELEKYGISYYAGWHPTKMLEQGLPNLVIVGASSGSHNPEVASAKELLIPVMSDAEVRGAYFSRDNSILCVGTWGKTSSTALLAHILREAGYDPSFVIGGLSLSTEPGYLGNSSWSIIEGDEYKSAPWDERPKFDHVKPLYLLLSAVTWDHADMYPNENDYFAVFERLVGRVPENGFIVACKDDQGVARVLKHFTGAILWYGKQNSEYSYKDVRQTVDGLDFVICHEAIDYPVHSPMMGTFQAENITGCFALAKKISIPPGKIVEAIKSFKGIRRRFEKRLEGPITIFDAHSPTADKASSVLSNLSGIYPGKRIAVFEPNIGGRERDAAVKYDNAFKEADLVIIPRLTKLKIDQNAPEQPLEGDQLARIISKTQQNTQYIEDDDKLVDFLVSNTKKGDVIVFLGSHGFRGMIEETIKKISS